MEWSVAQCNVVSVVCVMQCSVTVVVVLVVVVVSCSWCSVM